MPGASTQFCDDGESLNKRKKTEIEKPYKIELVWETIIGFGLLHIACLYSIYLLPSAKIATLLFGVFLYYFSGLGITAGAHRLWSHRSYKAKWPLRLLLVFMNNMAWQYTIIDWVRNHRVHHKYSDTNADPHNATRGFFFSHLGWMFCRKHSEVKEKGKTVDLSDLYSDPLLRFQKKYYVLLVPLCCFYLPSIVAVYGWNESWKNAFFICVILRYIITIHATCLVNSAAHLYGNKPYDKNIQPRQNAFVSLLTSGEGWHNYHHTFPWDYRAAEFGSGFSGSNVFIEYFARIGWAYNLKTAPTENIEKRVRRTGDGSARL